MLIRFMITAGLILAAVPARAEMFTWRDDAGRLVISNHRRGEAPPKTFPVVESRDIRATRYVAADRGRAYDDLIREHSREHGVRADLVRAVVQVESAFNPYARSPKGALGLMQLMPATIRSYGVRDPFNPAENVHAGVAYLRNLLDRYDNNEELALAAYNAGPGAVDNHGQTIPPYRETKDYVAHVNRLAGDRPIQIRGNTMYKTTQYVDGRAVTLYTDRRPTNGSYEVVSGR